LTPDSANTYTLENGLIALCAPAARSAGVTIEIFIPCGALTESLPCCSSVLEEWLWRGAGAYDSRALEDALDDLGVQRESEVSVDGLLLSFACLPDDLAASLSIAADLILRPHLETADFKPVLMQATSALEGLQDAPDSLLFTALSQAYFASPHGRSPFGTINGLSKLTSRNVRADFKRRCTPHGSLIAASGRLEPDRFAALIEQHFGAWRGARVPEPAVQTRADFYQHVPFDAAQTQIGLIFPVPALDAVGYYESRIMLEALSGSQSNRLFDAVREQRGLAYSVSASAGYGRGYGTLEVYAATAPARASETLEVLRLELTKLAAGITSEEFARAQLGILTSLALFEEAPSARAAAMIRDTRLLGRVRPLEEIRDAVQSLTLEAVNAWLLARPLEKPGVVTLGVVTVDSAALE
jgi:predicted Zn-dependent peptidase